MGRIMYFLSKMAFMLILPTVLFLENYYNRDLARLVPLDFQPDN